MTFTIAVVCEARADRDTACGLADRVLLEAADWIEKEELDYYRRWCGASKEQSFLPWKDVKSLARQENIRPHPSFDDSPIAPDAHAARRALLLLKKHGGFPDLVLLIRDDDRDARRRDGLEQARRWMAKHHRLVDRIVIGLAHPKRESWVLAGFDPRNDAERTLLDSICRELGFNPCTNAEQLTAKHEGDKRSAKRVLDCLRCGDPNREADCWNTIPLEFLRERGQHTGLADYLQELQLFFVPLFSPKTMDNP